MVMSVKGFWYCTTSYDVVRRRTTVLSFHFKNQQPLQLLEVTPRTFVATWSRLVQTPGREKKKVTINKMIKEKVLIWCYINIVWLALLPVSAPPCELFKCRLHAIFISPLSICLLARLSVIYYFYLPGNKTKKFVLWPNWFSLFSSRFYL